MKSPTQFKMFLRAAAGGLLVAGVMLSAGCAGDPTADVTEGFADGPDYRNGWYHWANGAQSVREVAAIYQRDPALTSELNRTRPEAIPAPNTALYIPPVHDRAMLRQILTHINANPAAVPTTPPTSAEYLPADQMMAFIMQPAPEPEPEIEAAAEPEPEPEPVEVEVAAPVEETPVGVAPQSEPEVAAGPEATQTEALEAAPVPTRVYSLKEAQERYDAQLAAARTTSAQSGRFNWPLQGKIIRPYSTNGAEPFPAIAIDAPEGSPIYASREGKVIFAGVLEGYGNVIILDHGTGLKSVYGYASTLQVKVNRAVVAGEQIALVGRPSVTAPSQLYFQIRKGNDPVNPLELLR